MSIVVTFPEQFETILFVHGHGLPGFDDRIVEAVAKVGPHCCGHACKLLYDQTINRIILVGCLHC